jgi:MbtH protein
VNEAAEDTREYRVVVNDEEQYSIWLADRPLPAGWRAISDALPKAACLELVEREWTDMRPLSLRAQMAQASLDPRS